MQNLSFKEETPSLEPTVILFAGPNVCKPTHLMHLRCFFVGQAVRNVLKALGMPVSGHAHIGNSNRHMGRVLLFLSKRFSSEDPDKQLEFVLEDVTPIDELSRQFVRWCHDVEKSEMREEASVWAAAIENQKALQEVVRYLTERSIVLWKKEFEALGVEVDEWAEENFYDTKTGDVFSLLGIKGEINSKGKERFLTSGPMLSDENGVSSWLTNDLAAISHLKSQGASKVVFVLNQILDTHVKALKFSAESLGFSENIGFMRLGTMFDITGKPHKNEAGMKMSIDEFLGRLCSEDKLAIAAKEFPWLKCEAQAKNLLVDLFKLKMLNVEKGKHFRFDLEAFPENCSQFYPVFQKLQLVRENHAHEINDKSLSAGLKAILEIAESESGATILVEAVMRLSENLSIERVKDVKTFLRLVEVLGVR